MKKKQNTIINQKLKMFKIFKKNIRRSPYQSLAVILNVNLSIFLISIFFLVGAGSQAILTFFESKPQVIAYLRDEATTQEIDLLKEKIVSTGKSKEIKYISKDDALQIYKDLFKDKPVLLEMVTAKFLPSSLEISTTDISALKEVAEIIKKEPSVEDVDFQEDIVSSLSGWIVSVRKFGLILAGFLFVNSVLTILVILGMRISQRKNEIEILKLLGASSLYIRGPMYLEGVFYGLVSAFLSWGLSYLVIIYATPFLKQFLTGIPIFPVNIIFMAEVLAGLAGLGILIGFLGSVLAVFWFMKSSR